MKIKIIIYILIIASLYSCSTSTKNFKPANIAGLELKKVISGEEAKEYVDKLHMKSVSPAKNEIAIYEDHRGNAKIYISYYDNRSDAEENERKMTEKISPENSVFLDGKYMDLGDRQVYRCFGMGQSHFVFSEGNTLIWISVESARGRQFVTDYLNLINS